MVIDGSGLRSLLQRGPAWPSRPASYKLIPSQSGTGLVPAPPKLPPASGKSLSSSEAHRECPPWPLPPPNPHVTLSFLFSRTCSVSICAHVHLRNGELPEGLGLLLHLRAICCRCVMPKKFSQALMYVATWMGLKDTVVSEISWPHKDQYSVILLTWGACGGDIQRQKAERRLSRAAEGEWGAVQRGTEFLGRGTEQCMGLAGQQRECMRNVTELPT